MQLLRAVIQHRQLRQVSGRRWHSSSADIVRNEVGVQLLNRHLHRQIFKGTPFSPPDPRAVVVAREHLRMHGLDISKGSTAPDIGFELPPLQGSNIDEHFHRLGAAAAEPWIAHSKTLASTDLPPIPQNWEISPGWVRYTCSSSPQPVSYPHPEEEALVFDVETMPHYSHFPVIAVAASSQAWYCWISPWLLGASRSPSHLVTFGDPTSFRLVVGHNVSFDRARILEEYSFDQTRTRFLDTMALHIAVKGMSSGQRPAWMKYNKQREENESLEPEGRESHLISEHLTGTTVEGDGEEHSELEGNERWEEVTSANSLLHVARLYCGIKMDKTLREDLLTVTREEVRTSIQSYIGYCALDVSTTHSVFKHVLPAFLSACPSPVSFAGILTMASAFLPVDQTWAEYLEQSETTYRRLEASVKLNLQELAETARQRMETSSWKEDVWLSQLDWTPKKPKEPRKAGAQTKLEQSPAGAQNPPRWYQELRDIGPFTDPRIKATLGHLLCLTHQGQPVVYSQQFGWHFNSSDEPIPIARRTLRKGLVRNLLSRDVVPLVPKPEAEILYSRLREGNSDAATRRSVLRLARRTLAKCTREPRLSVENPWLQKLDWSICITRNARSVDRQALVPKWYWDIMKPSEGGSMNIEVTVRCRIAPLLLKLKWEGYPLFFSREHGWVFRVPVEEKYVTKKSVLRFSVDADDPLRTASSSGSYVFYKLPHKDGESANVGSPLSKNFISAAQKGILTSPERIATHALDMNAQCSYWISSRDRVMKQMVIWDQRADVDFGAPETWPKQRLGIILPQVITMGTVTRRAIEKTWLTASNAKRNRVGSELKAMVRAPPQYYFVGADVDSEELWISSVMGDAQFGIHGASAIGWMTLEGTKAEKSDLHSKTAAILGITRDAAKIFNYSRIYGAGMRHAQLLLLQNNPSMDPEVAKKLASDLYSATKGRKLSNEQLFGRKIWFGGSESFVFNKLEEIAASSWPKTPALGCGITSALKKQHLPSHFGSDYMPSRINWVVQSSGVDYLHLLIVAMDYLVAFYGLRARYLISVHDELRYMAHEDDRYMVAFALQIANLWTRCQFAYRLGMNDLPQSVAFFSSVDVDHVLRKEPHMTCETPSHTTPISPGESLDMANILERVSVPANKPLQLPLREYEHPNCMEHRCHSVEFLRAQATDQLNELKQLARGKYDPKVLPNIGEARQIRRLTKEQILRFV